MVNFTSNTYQLKREILSFSNKISRKLPKPERKFMADMNYGILLPAAVCLPTSSTSYMNLPEKSILLTVFPNILQRVPLKML